MGLMFALTLALLGTVDVGQIVTEKIEEAAPGDASSDLD